MLPRSSGRLAEATDQATFGQNFARALKKLRRGSISRLPDAQGTSREHKNEGQESEMVLLHYQLPKGGTI